MTQRYDTYKNSGVQWLGEIPGHWNGMRLINCITSSAVGAWGADEKKDGTDILCLRVADFDYDKGVIKEDKLTYRNYEGKLSKEKLFDVGDLLIEKSGGGDIYPVGRVVRYSLSKNAIATCSNFIQKITPNKDVVLSDYLYFWFKMIYSIKINGLYYNQTTGIQNLKLNEYLRQTAYLPPLPEQHAIVSYLDDKCGKIDEWIEKKQKEVELLGEMKQRVIADAVTRGLDPNVKMKQTNIPWLPEVPEHWEILRAKHMFNKEQRPVEEGDEIVTCFRDGEVTLRKNRRTTGFTEATDYSHYQHICKGDLVIHQMDAFAGSAGVSDSDGMGTPVLSVCTPKLSNILNEYYAHIVRMMGKNGFILSLYRGIRERSSDFRFDTFAKLWLPVPPLSEQRAIVSYITERTAKIDKMVENVNKEIEALKEYRQRLISDVVTGQIKVC